MIYDSGILREPLSPERENPARGGRSAPELRQSTFGKFRAYSTGLVKSLLFREELMLQDQCFI